MVGYRRNLVPGGTYFFTVALQDRSSTFLTEHSETLVHAIQTVRNKTYFDEVATVILPDHMHTIWTLPCNDSDYPGRWKAIKSLFTRALVKSRIPLTRNSRGEYRLWQKRYWEHTISDEHDLRSHIDYIHFNPVKHGHVGHSSEWPYSTFHRYVRSGLLPSDWSGGAHEAEDMNFGE